MALDGRRERRGYSRRVVDVRYVRVSRLDVANRDLVVVTDVRVVGDVSHGDGRVLLMMSMGSHGVGSPVPESLGPSSTPVPCRPVARGPPPLGRRGLGKPFSPVPVSTRVQRMERRYVTGKGSVDFFLSLFGDILDASSLVVPRM